MSEKIYYSYDWILQEIEPINPKWYSLDNQLELNFNLVTEEFKEKVGEILKKLKYETSDENLKKAYKAIIVYTKIIMADMANQLSQPFYEHFNKNYPILPIREEDYKNPEIRNAWLNTIKKLREDLFKVERIDSSKILPPNLIDEFHKNNFKKIEEALELQDKNQNFLKDPVPPITLIGVDYSAESLRKNLNKENLPEEEKLENQKENAYADYYLGVVVLTTECSLYLLNIGLKKERKLSFNDKKFLEIIAEELDHRRCDLYLSIEKGELEKISKQTGLKEEEIILWRTPRYGLEQIKNEHIFLTEIGDKGYGYNGVVSKFIRKRGLDYIGKLEPLIKFFVEEKALIEQNPTYNSLALDASVKR